jgi:hypothetical protein
MDIELDDERPELRDEDKTRQLVVPVRGPAIDDLTGGDDTTASALPPPDVSPFAAAAGASEAVGATALGRGVPRALPPAPRAPVDAPASPSAAETELATRTTNPSMAEAAAKAAAMAAKATAPIDKPLPPTPALPPLPNAQRTSLPEPEATTSGRGDSAPPTIVVKPIVHEPSRRLQREATVVVRRAVRKTRRSPMVLAVMVAVGIVALALVGAGVYRWWQNRAKEERIEQRIEAIRRSGAQ